MLLPKLKAPRPLADQPSRALLPMRSNVPAPPSPINAALSSCKKGGFERNQSSHPLACTLIHLLSPSTEPEHKTAPESPDSLPISPYTRPHFPLLNRLPLIWQQEKTREQKSPSSLLFSLEAGHFRASPRHPSIGCSPFANALIISSIPAAATTPGGGAAAATPPTAPAHHSFVPAATPGGGAATATPPTSSCSTIEEKAATSSSARKRRTVPHSWNCCHSLSSILPITAAPSLERSHAKRSREEEEQPQPAVAPPSKKNRNLHLYAGEGSSSKALPDTENSLPFSSQPRQPHQEQSTSSPPPPAATVFLVDNSTVGSRRRKGKRGEQS
ncbi:uncharacterized protein LOC133671262 [Populus nigra]|uniref:uncharacterized protein LOC133671262 n=1 Tax=Populus nigra TaxID=3691 RepID=UPI002B2705C7|nr:uncharacterized protein LOC133671262 [Populus nigra]